MNKPVKFITSMGISIPHDRYGGTTAFCCLDCGSPVIASTKQDQMGSAPSNPATCPSCGRNFWMENKEDEGVFLLHPLKKGR